MTVRRLGAWPVLGRQQDLQAVDSALAVPGGVVVLVGGAGVGKTTLARLAADRMVRRGWRRLTVSASRSTTSIPFGSLAFLLEGEPADQPVDGGTIARLLAVITAGEEPTVVMVDDAHLLDDGSASVIAHLAGRSRFSIVATIRFREPVPGPIARVCEDDRVLRVRVAPLERATHDELVCAAVRGPVDGGTLQFLWERSEGNPLFLRELVLASHQQGGLAPHEGVWRIQQPTPIPETLRDVVRARHDELSEELRAAAETLAMAGPIPLAEAMRAVPSGALEQLEHRGIVEVLADGETIALAHPLHADTLVAGLADLRRRRLARGLADAALASSDGRPDGLVRMARWRRVAGDELTAGEALESAAAALSLQDFDLAIELASEAHALSPSDQSVTVVAQTLTAMGAGAEVENLLSSWTSATDHGRYHHAILRAENLIFVLGDADRAMAVLDEACQQVGGEARGEIVGELALLRVLRGDPNGALEATAALDGSTNTVRVKAIVASAPAWALLGYPLRAASLAAEGISIRALIDDDAPVANEGVLWVAHIFGLTEAGRLDDAHAVVRAAYDFAVVNARSGAHAWFALQRGRVDALRGDLPAAVRWFGEAAARFGDAAQQGLRRWSLGCSALARAQLGEIDHARADLNSADVLPTALAMMQPDIERARGWIMLGSAGLDAAVERFLIAAELAWSTGQNILGVAALHDLVRLGVRDHALELIERCRDVEGPLAVARADHARAVYDDDLDALAVVATQFEQMGAALLAAEANVQSSRGQLGGRGRLAGGVRSVLTDSPMDLAVLTGREHEVAELAAAGYTNREVADQLYISVRTAENHLQRAYRKLGVDNREDLAGLLRRGTSISRAR